MTLRTPRRRISPRTKHRYRVVRNFFRRALGTSSQPDIKISSSIAVNVTDLKHKIIGLEDQLNEVSKHCSELACSETLVPTELKHKKEFIGVPSERKSTAAETKILYKTSESHYKKSEDSDYSPKKYNDAYESNKIHAEFYKAHDDTKLKKKKGNKLGDRLKNHDPHLHKHKTRSVYENFASAYSTSSFHSLTDPKMAHYSNAGFSDRYQDRRNLNREYANIQHKDKRHKEHITKVIHEKKNTGDKTNKYENRELDQDFIADIIRRQYKPVKIFGKRESHISQFSAPLCRDQEFSIRENINEDAELCSCCFEGQRRPKNTRHKDPCDMRSICDTRLYSSKKNSRARHRRRHTDVYNNDSDLYDLIPVKEKSSPKSRKKFAEDNMIAYDYNKEVPPSPRTLRPRLNLKAQYYAEFEDYKARAKQRYRKYSPSRPIRHMDCGETYESYISSEIARNGNHRQSQKVQENKFPVPRLDHMQHDTGTMSSLQYANFVNEQNVTTDTAFNKTQEIDLSVDKTDKTLCEIKDILQSFLLEIKKETTASQCDKTDVTSKSANHGISNIQHTSADMNTSMIPNSGHSFNNYALAQCSMPPYMPTFPNPCCCPILPLCPMNCMQNGYLMPSPSFTCPNCANTKTPVQNENPTKSTNNAVNEVCNPETEQLIKEIYKYVSQSPIPRKKEYCDDENKQMTAKILTSRSAGGSTMTSKHDAKVGTPKMKCYSKSCEAIGSKIISDAYYSGANATYSDTILERLSLEATPTDSMSNTDFTHTSTSVEKGTGNRFAKVLRSFGLLKKKKNRDVIEELSDSESTIDVEVKPKPTHFRSEITNYMMHGQEYYQKPPVPPPPMPPYHQRPPDYHGYQQPYNHGMPEYSQNISDPYNPHRIHQQTIHEHNASYYDSGPNPTAPPYPNSFEKYNHIQQQVPLCLKEIEVKSTGTQSERKMSFFRKIKTKMQPLEQTTVRSDGHPQRNCSTQTAQDKPGLFSFKNLQNKSINKADQGLFGIKNLQNKSMNNTDPRAFSYWKQKQLAEGDIKMRNAMVKKLFHKRNPFSPRNLIVRTLLGKDKSSFGEPPTTYKARMFL